MNLFSMTVFRLQQQRDDDNILGNGVYDKLVGAVCFFSDNNKPMGAGFAISTTTVYSVAMVGTKVACQFGKPNQHVTRRLKISVLDRNLDYYVLNTVPGEEPLSIFFWKSQQSHCNQERIAFWHPFKLESKMISKISTITFPLAFSGARLLNCTPTILFIHVHLLGVTAGVQLC
jgi:hypothetical protein